MMIEFFFYLFAALAVISAGVILLSDNILYAAFSLVVTFLCVAGVYVIAGAEFIAITQIMIYVGGIVVLLIFGVMLTNKISGKAMRTSSRNKLSGGLICFFLAALLLFGIYKINFFLLNPSQQKEQYNNVEQLGIGLMSDYILPFEIAAVLLLAALIGAATIAGYKQKQDEY